MTKKLNIILLSCAITAGFITSVDAAGTQVVRSGNGWQRINVSGVSAFGITATDSETREVYVISNSEGLTNSDLPQVVKDEVSQDFINAPNEVYLDASTSLNSTNEASQPVVIDAGVVDAIANGTVEQKYGQYAEYDTPPPGVQTLGLYCEDAWKNKTENFDFGNSISLGKANFLGAEITGTATFDGQIQAANTLASNQGRAIKGHFKYKKKRTRVGCVPYRWKFREFYVGIDASFSNAKLYVDATATYSVSKNLFHQQIAEPTLADIWFFIGPLPVNVKITLPIEVGLRAHASAAATLKLNSLLNGYYAATFTCTRGDGCASNLIGNTLSWDQNQSGVVSTGISTDIGITPYVTILGKAVVYSDNFFGIESGIETSVTGRMVSYRGSTCSDANDDRQYEFVEGTFRDATLKLRWISDATGWVAGFGYVNKKIVEFIDNLDYDLYSKNLYFSSEYSNGRHYQPVIDLPDPYGTSLKQDGGGFYLNTRECLPYHSKINYLINWGDGTSSSVSASGATPFVHKWPTSGNYKIQVTTLSDKAGRNFPDETTEVNVSVAVNGAVPGQSSSVGSSSNLAARLAPIFGLLLD